MVGPLGGGARGLRVPTTYVRDIDGGPLGCGARTSGAFTTYVGDVDGRPRGPLEGPDLNHDPKSVLLPTQVA
jgi:hypothetical protein